MERKHPDRVVRKKQKHNSWQMGSLSLSSMPIITLISWIYWIIMTKLVLISKKPLLCFQKKMISSTTRILLHLKQLTAPVGASLTTITTLTFLLDLFFQLQKIWQIAKAVSCDWSQLVKMAISALRILKWRISLSINDFSTSAKVDKK